jgi:hypothetical protein
VSKRESAAIDEAVGAGGRSPAPAAPRSVKPPEIRVSMVVRGYRRRYGGMVHLAPRSNANALCGAGHVSGDPVRGDDGGVCQACKALAGAD